MKKNKSALKFIDYIVDYVNFSVNKEFNSDSVTIDFDLKRNVEISSDNKMTVNLIIDVFPDYKKVEFPFNLKASFTGFFELNVDEAEFEANSYAEINGVAILFPYVRALISTYTANANIQPLILPPINVVKYIEESNKKNGQQSV